MKTILILRHAKSDWNADFRYDHERPLNKRGRKAAQAVGRYLAATDQVPERVITSSAVRARETLALVLEAGAWTSEVRETDALYEATLSDVLREVQAAPDEAERLLLVGHEPTWSETVSELIGDAQVRFPTATIARIDLDVGRWADVRWGGGELVWLIPPKLLPS